MTVPSHLHVLLAGRPIGRVERTADRLRFVYDDRWRHGGPDIPLSLSMPLIDKEHGDAVIRSWMWGLLPDNDHILNRLGREHDVSPRNAFALLSKIGEDCAGAVQFVAPERLDHATEEGSFVPIDDSEIEHRLLELRERASTGRRRGDPGAFSLAGAQAKTALCPKQGRWGIPGGRIPTTHIFKPPMADFDGHVQNEHACLVAARELGLPVARSQVARFGAEIAIVVERYDRVQRGDTVLRIHQEDACQALAIHPGSKYERDGGPGIATIMELLNASSEAETDRGTFMAAAAFNFLIAGTDAHAKNYSLVLTPSKVCLAPLYDVASFLPYVDQWQDVRSAMKVGGKYRHVDMVRRHWERTAQAAGYDPNAAAGLVEEMARRLPDAMSDVVRECGRQGIGHQVLDRLLDRLADRCARVLRDFSFGTPTQSGLSEDDRDGEWANGRQGAAAGRPSPLGS